VGRGACLNLNVPPDRRGRIHESDIAALREFRRILDATFAKDYAQNAGFPAGVSRGDAKEFCPLNLTDQNPDTYWATPDEMLAPEVVLDLLRPVTFNVVSLREYLPLGQRVSGFALDAWTDRGWVEFATGTSIGNRRLIRGNSFTTTKVRLRITKAVACPALSELALYLEPVGGGKAKAAAK